MLEYPHSVLVLSLKNLKNKTVTETNTGNLKSGKKKTDWLEYQDISNDLIYSTWGTGKTCGLKPDRWLKTETAKPQGKFDSKRQRTGEEVCLAEKKTTLIPILHLPNPKIKISLPYRSLADWDVGISIPTNYSKWESQLCVLHCDGIIGIQSRDKFLAHLRSKELVQVIPPFTSPSC